MVDQCVIEYVFIESVGGYGGIRDDGLIDLCFFIDCVLLCICDCLLSDDGRVGLCGGIDDVNFLFHLGLQLFDFLQNHLCLLFKLFYVPILHGDLCVHFL